MDTSYAVGHVTCLLVVADSEVVRWSLSVGRPGTEADVSPWDVLGKRCSTDIAECYQCVYSQ